MIYGHVGRPYWWRDILHISGSNPNAYLELSQWHREASRDPAAFARVLAETVCAEKVALLKALEAGEREFYMVAVSTVSDPPASPCGSCRQLLFHWGFDRVISGNPEGAVAEWTVAELLPAAFRVD